MTRPRGPAGRALIVVCLAAGIVTAAPPSAQVPDRPPQIFRGGTNLVYVDAYPRREDRLLEGLRAEDFQVFEDGKPQAVQTFEYIRFEPSPIDADRRDPTSVADAERQAADPRNRVFVVYLDMYHVGRRGSADVRRPVLDFLNRTIGASDLFAVMTPEIPVSRLTFARRTDTVEAELTKFWDWGQNDPTLGGTTIPRTPFEERIVQCAFGENTQVEAVVDLFREDQTYASLEGLMVRLHGLRDERMNVVLLTGGFAPRREQLQLANFSNSGMPPIPKIGVTRGGRLVQGDPQSLNPDRAWCRAQIARLANINFIDRFRDLVASAQRANVSFYPVDVHGLQVGGPTADQRVSPGAASILDAAREAATLTTLANATDGYAAVNSNDLSLGFRRIADRLSAYYLLSYYSTNTVNDGRFRKIEVKVTQPRVSVAARRGYFAPASDAVVAKAMAETAARAGPAVPEAMTAALDRLGRLSSGQEVFAYAAASPGAVDVVTELATRELERGRWAKGAGVDVTVTDAAGTTASAHAQIEPGGRAVVVRVPFAQGQTGPWRVRARVTGDQGPAEDRLEVGAPEGTLLGAPVVFRGASSARAALQPVAEFSFRRNERIHVEWPVLGTLDQRTARVLDRRGQPIGSGIALTEREVEAGRPVVSADLALSSLADGDYAIEVTAANGPTVDRKLVAFRVGR